MEQDVKERVIRIIAEQALIDPNDVSMDQTLEDLSLDSMALVEAIFAIEEEFDLTVPFNANEPNKSEFDISSVATMVAAVENLVAAQTA